MNYQSKIFLGECKLWPHFLQTQWSYEPKNSINEVWIKSRLCWIHFSWHTSGSGWRISHVLFQVRSFAFECIKLMIMLFYFSFFETLEYMDVAFLDWSIYLVERKFKVLPNSTFVDLSVNSFDGGPAEQILYSNYVSNWWCSNNSNCIYSIASLKCYVDKCIRTVLH